MKRSRRIATVVAVLVAIVLVLLAVLPTFFNGPIARRVRAEVNQRVNARVTWHDAGLSFFRHFPNLSLSLNGLSVVGVGRFQRDTLAAVQHLRVVLDVASVVSMLTRGAPLVVRAVDLDQPRLRLLTLADGSVNWDIAKPAPSSGSAAAGVSGAGAQPAGQKSGTLGVRLRRFQISNASVLFDNRASNLTASLAGFSQTLSGDLSQQRVVIHTKAEADTVNVVFAGIPYLHHVRLALSADIDADLAGKTYTLQNTELHLNDLTLAAAGTVRSAADQLGVDVTFKTPSTDFRRVLSLVPAIYAHDFAKLQTTGTFTVSGWVKGDYGKAAFPAFSLTTTVDKASFKYPDLPLPTRDIGIELALTNPGGSPDRTVVTLDRFHLVLGNNPVDAHMVLTTPVSDPNVDASVSGTLDLGDVARTVKLDGIDDLAGTIAANASVSTRMSWLQRHEYSRVAASGTVNVSGLTVKGAALPQPLSIQRAALTLAPQHAQLRSFAGTIGSSDVQASGTLDNLLGFVLQGDTLQGSATVSSKRFNLNEWKSDTSSLQVIPVPPRLDLTLNASVAELLYGKLTMTDARGQVRIRNQRATLEHFQMNALGGQLGLTGYYETTDPAKPTFNVDLSMAKVEMPRAYQAFATVQALAPMAKYASGTLSTTVHVAGALGQNMLPLLPGLSGTGTLQTSQLVMRDFPPLQKVAEVTKLQFLDNPTLQALDASFTIQDGRLFMRPFTTKVGSVAMQVAGSNGLDQSLDYTVDLGVPRSMLGSGANQALAGVMSKAAKAGLNLSPSSELPVAIKIGGSVTSPTVSADLGSVVSSVGTAAVAAAENAKQAATQAAKEKASAQAARMVQAAETQAEQIRKDARALAAKVKAEGYRQADSLTARAGGNPLAQMAAKAAADKLRKTADDKSAAIVREADQRADSAVAVAKRQAAKVGGEE